MADTADTADIMANRANILARYRREADMADRANILARYRREADTSSAEAGRKNSAAATRENTATGEVETGVAAIGVATGAIMDSTVTDSSSPVDLVIRTTGVGIPLGAGAFPGVGTPLGVGAFLTRLATAMILMGIILRMGTIMVIRTTGIRTPIGPGAFPTRLTTTIILTGIILRMGTIMVTTATPLTDTAMDLRLPNCKAGWPKLAITMARSMG